MENNKFGVDLIGTWVHLRHSGECGWIREYFDGWYVIETEEGLLELAKRSQFLIMKDGESEC